ncbi:hypothetical protein [Halomicrobium sp. LC1Hm]|uniref:hypothetical protein n=1 Tax=Halomicrobium sp. LC1Hm TaxID=2610902 RepID=UPI0012A78F42|nr:hypothetical protein [Halomicrobium sp. LC1Hm]QGA81098.1 hypothetical protein LC1Hm_0027 [Halomicrobium sp. LC1Hm]
MTGRKNALRMLLALFIVGSVVPAPTVAQSDNEYSHQFTDGPQKVVVDQKNISGDFTVTVSTNQATGAVGKKTLLQRVQLGPGAEQDIVYDNYGAYDNITVEVTVHGGGEPDISDGGIKVPYNIGHTGGDRDLRCDTTDRLYSLTNPGVTVTDCTPPVNNDVNTTNTDAEQLEIDIYQSAQNQQASTEVYHTTLNNYLEDTATQARIIGKNAYIRALNNGSSESVATSEAKDAVADYYAKKQVHLADMWTLGMENYQYRKDVISNESGISSGYLSQQHHSDYSSWATDPSLGAFVDETMTLTNGSTTTVTGVEASGDMGGDCLMDVTVDPQKASYHCDPSSWWYDGHSMNAPNSNYESLPHHNASRYVDRWDAIESQNDAVQNDMDTLATNTYDEYQAGEINNSDLVDPYVLSNDFSAGDEHQSWAAAQLTLLGTNSPEAMSNMGEFNVTTADGTTHTGVLMSQSNPSTGQFEVNTTYDTANITGPQFVVTADRLVELDGEFTIDSIETTDGESRQNVTIEKTTYETADINVTQMKQLYENLQKERAQWEAREQNLRGGAGGFAFGNSTTLGILAALAGGMLLLRNRDDGGQY